LHNHQFW